MSEPALELRPDLLIAYDSGIESRPPWGQFLLTIEGSGVAKLANSMGGRARAWTASIDGSVIERVLAALREARFPHVDSHWIPAGSALRVLSVQAGGFEAHTWPIAWHSVAKLPGYAAAFGILDAIVHEMSGDTLEIAVNGERGLISDIRAT